MLAAYWGRSRSRSRRRAGSKVVLCTRALQGNVGNDRRLARRTCRYSRRCNRLGSQVNAGLLVLWTATRSKNRPDAPTLRETGIDMVSNSPFGIAGPKGMDPAVVKIVQHAFTKGAEDSTYLEATTKLDHEPAYMHSHDCRRYGQFVEKKADRGSRPQEGVGC
jgi:hypothetical protein